MSHDERRQMNFRSFIQTYAPLIITMFFAVGAWFQVKSNLENVQRDVAEKSAKYIPIIEATEHRITVVEEVNKQVMDSLRRIERKLDR